MKSTDDYNFQPHSDWNNFHYQLIRLELLLNAVNYTVNSIQKIVDNFIIFHSYVPNNS